MADPAYRKRQLRAGLGGTALAVFAGMVSFLIESEFLRGASLGFAGTFVLLTIALVSNLAHTSKSAKDAVKGMVTADRYASVLGRTTLTLTDEGLRLSAEGVASLLRWHGVREIVQDEKFIWFFYLPNHGPSLPRRVFADRAAAEAFVDTVRRRCSNLWTTR